MTVEPHTSSGRLGRLPYPAGPDLPQTGPGVQPTGSGRPPPRPRLHPTGPGLSQTRPGLNPTRPGLYTPGPAPHLPRHQLATDPRALVPQAVQRREPRGNDGSPTGTHHCPGALCLSVAGHGSRPDSKSLAPQRFADTHRQDPPVYRTCPDSSRRVPTCPAPAPAPAPALPCPALPWHNRTPRSGGPRWAA
jgi:hypothetical protein